MITYTQLGEIVIGGPQKFPVRFGHIGLFVLNSHTFNEMRNSFDVKRKGKQIPESEIGVIYIDADFVNIDPRNFIRYLKIIARLLGISAWNGDSNARIGGICVSASQVLMIKKQGNFEYLKCDGIYNTIIRDNRPEKLPDWFTRVSPETGS